MTKLEIVEVKLKILGNDKLKGKYIIFDEDGNVRIPTDMAINISELEYIK